MKVICAKSLGMCFGVRDALWTIEHIEKPEEVTILGELVHNEQVQSELEIRGFRTVSEDQRASTHPDTPAVLVTAHGISDALRQKLLSAGKQLIDTTCPLVHHVHDTAVRYQREGYFVVIAGCRGHVEVGGIVGDLEHFDVVQRPEDARAYPHKRIAVVCQSTTRPVVAQTVFEAVRRANPDRQVEFANTVCRPTRQRQQAALELIQRVQALIVVGGAHSNNCIQLAALAKQQGIPVKHVQTAADLDPVWVRQFHTIGLTAGTSTLDRTIDEVYDALLALGGEFEFAEAV